MVHLFHTLMNRGKTTIVELMEVVEIVSFYFQFICRMQSLFLNDTISKGTPTKGNNRMSPTLGGSDSFSDRQFIAITSEKSARVIALPSQNCVYRQQIADTDYVVKAEIISFKGKARISIICSWIITTSTNWQLLIAFEFQIAFVLFVISPPVVWLHTVCQVFGHWWTSIFCHWPISGISLFFVLNFTVRMENWINQKLLTLFFSPNSN